MQKSKQIFNGAWVVDISMGYGHQRAAFAIGDLAKHGKVIHADHYVGIPHSDKMIWETSKELYETISRFKNIPVLGDIIFGIFDKFQAIQDFYPRMQNIDHPTLQLKQVYGFIEKKQWGKHLIQKLNEHPLPLIATFPAVAFMAEYFKYEGPVWLVVTDTDVSRAWAPLKASQTEIGYFASSQIAKERLVRYGVPRRNIFDTGFPLPKDCVRTAKESLKRRIQALDPFEKYVGRYSTLVQQYVGAFPQKKKQIPVVTFAIGGAGAQEDIAREALQGLTPLLKRGMIRFIIVAATHKEIAQRFHEMIVRLKLSSCVAVVYKNSVEEYFKEFSNVLRITDILWTKPSELVFYAALGIPILFAPPVGSQEEGNRDWLLSVGAGIKQSAPKFVGEWMSDMIVEGVFAEAAMQGYVEMERNGAEHITKIIEHTA